MRSGGGRGRRSVSPTELVHDCYLKLARARALGSLERTEFVALASRAIRNVLVDRARELRALKREGPNRRVTLEGASLPLEQEVDLLDLDVALQKLALLDERQSRVVEMRFFGGPHARGDRQDPGLLAAHGEQRMGHGEGLAAPRAQREVAAPFPFPGAVARSAPR